MAYNYYTERRPVKRHHVFLLVLLVVLSVLLMAYFKLIPAKSFGQPGNASLAGENEGSLPEDTREALQAMAGEKPQVQEVMDHPQQYPERLLDALARNPELLDFTLDYPKKAGASRSRIDLSGKYKPGTIPLLMQWDEDWGYDSYGSGIIALDGCGPTALSMVAVGLTGNTEWNPKAVARFSEENGYLDAKSNSTLWTLMSEGAEKLGLSSKEIPLSKSRMAGELSQGHPIICAMGPGDFTTDGHFIVLTGYQNGGFTIRDPFSKIRSGKRWSYDTLKPQIRDIWAFAG